MSYNYSSEIPINQLLNLFTGIPQGTSRSTSRQHYFSVDLVDQDDTIYIYAELPGVNKENIDIDVYNNNLTIKATKECSYDNPSVSEIKYGNMERVITLPICVTQQETVSVDFRNGLLRIKINKLVEEGNRFRVNVDRDDNNNE